MVQWKKPAAVDGTLDALKGLTHHRRRQHQHLHHIFLLLITPRVVVVVGGVTPFEGDSAPAIECPAFSLAHRGPWSLFVWPNTATR